MSMCILMFVQSGKTKVCVALKICVITLGLTMRDQTMVTKNADPFLKSISTEISLLRTGYANLSKVYAFMAAVKELAISLG